jgi:signal transduction histidine kinase
MQKPHLTIRMTLLIIVSLLNLLIAILVGKGVYTAWIHHQQAQELQLRAELINTLYIANKNLSLTRASTLSLLSSTPEDFDALYSDLLTHRHETDSALTKALASMQQNNLHNTQEEFTKIKDKYQLLIQRRKEIDKDLTLPLAERHPELIDHFFADNTALITEIHHFTLQYSRSLQDIDDTISRHMMFEHFVWELAEYTGKQYAIIGQILATNKYPGKAQHQELTALRNRVEYGWEILQKFSLNTSLSEKLHPLMEEARTQYFFTFDQISDLFFDNPYPGTAASYPIDSTLWLGISAQAVDSLLILQDETLKASQTHVDEIESRAQQEILISGIIFILALLLSFYCWILMAFRVIHPFNAMVNALYKATQENIFEMPDIRYKQDEIGKLAQVLEVFKNNAQKMKQSNEELERFAFIAAHDLKSPLRAIENISSWLEEDVGEIIPAASKKHLQELRNRVRLMDKMLDDTLEYARIETKIEAQSNMVVSGQSLVEEIIELLDLPPNFNVKIGNDLAHLSLKKLPLQQVLFNLVNNAIKHHDKPAGLIEVDAQENNTEYIFHVRDDGPGIEPQYHHKIFEMFQTLQSREKSKGRGMGLAMVRKIVSAAGGVINVKSTLGQGAEFQFTWPKKNL